MNLQSGQDVSNIVEQGVDADESNPDDAIDADPLQTARNQRGKRNRYHNHTTYEFVDP